MTGAGVVPESTLTCPECRHEKTETMPTDACIYIYQCEVCGTQLKPKPGDFCAFCSYGNVQCPPMQSVDGCGCS